MSTADASERLLNLIIALSNARGRMTRTQIRSTVSGYDKPHRGDDDAATKKRDAAFERMFERDKDDLRKMGIPIRTVTDVAHGDNIGYVIDAGEAAMPPVEFTASERAVLAIAADYWQNAALGTEARRALTKVSSSAARGNVESLALGATALHSADAAVPLAQAMQDRQAVTFTYVSAASGRAVRTVEPWRLVVRGGALYLVGLDRDREEARTYRTNRIEGAITAIGDVAAFDPPADMPATQLAESVPALTARIGLRAESGHAIRRRAAFWENAGEWDVFDVDYSDTDALRDEVLALAGAARVLAPPVLVDAVREHAVAALEVAGG